MVVNFFSILSAVFTLCFVQSTGLAIHRKNQNYNTLYLKLSQNLSLVIDDGDVSDKFLSFQLDSFSLRNMKTLPINDPKFVNLALHLSPAYVRVGGTDADCLYFEEAETKTINKQDYNVSSLDDQKKNNFTLSSVDFLSLYEFTKKAGIKMMFDLNTLLRNVDGSWNSDNAKKIIMFAKGHEMEIDWQLGNEPNSFPHVFNVSIPAGQLGKDYCKLREILNKSGWKRSILVGPEVNHIDDEGRKGVTYAKKFLENVDDCIDYVTWHQYYLDGRVATVQDFINASVFNKLPAQIKAMKEALNSIKRDFPMWLSETSSAYGGGAPNLSDRFVAGFLWLDKLGYSAKARIQVVIRESFYYGHYALIGYDLNPNPDWWISVIYKKLVSGKVLNLKISNNFGNIRLYAHCAIKQAFLSEDPAVVIYGVNLNEKPAHIYIQGISKNAKIFSYYLTSDNLPSRNIFMNDEILQLKSDGSLPYFKPKIIDSNQTIILPRYSMVFLVIQGLNVPFC